MTEKKSLDRSKVHSSPSVKILLPSNFLIAFFVCTCDSDGSVVVTLDGTPRTSSKDEGTMSNRLPEKKPTRKISFADLAEISSNKDEKIPLQKDPERDPSLRRPPTFADKQLSVADSRKPLKSPPPPPPPLPPIARKPGPADSAAAAWEKEEMASIRERYMMRQTERERVREFIPFLRSQFNT